MLLTQVLLVVPAGIAGTQRPWSRGGFRTRRPYIHLPVFWIPAIPAGMTAFQHMCITARAGAWERANARNISIAFLHHTSCIPVLVANTQALCALSYRRCL